MNNGPLSELPHTDTKPQGAADFYFAINATFRFILRRQGYAGWQRYLEELGRAYYAPVNQRWREGGLPAIARYWRAFFGAEPGAEVDVVEGTGDIEVRVNVCPAIKHLRASGREIVREYCQHCYHLGNSRAAAAGFTMRLTGGNGSCCHRFTAADPATQPQAMSDIKEARL